jgi:hypothetical protein
MEMVRDVYKKMAFLIDAHKRCLEKDTEEAKEWADKHAQAIEDLLQELPHGGGIGNWIFDYGRSDGEKLVLYNGITVMDNNGCGTKTRYFQVIVKGSLMFGIAIHIIGNFGKDQDVKEYLYQILQ